MFFGCTSAAGVSDEQLYRHILKWKGAVFVRQRQMRNLRAEAKHGADRELLKLYQQLQTATRQLAQLAFSVPHPDQSNAWKRQVQVLTRQKERLERSLAEKSQSFRSATDLVKVTPDRIRAALPDDAVFVDFFEFIHGTPPTDGTSDFRYETRMIAFLLGRDKKIRRVDLGPVEPLNELARQWRSEVVAQAGGNIPEATVELRRRLWQPLHSHLKNAKTVLISPDGVLARIPFAALPGQKPDTYLIEEYRLVTIPVPQMLYRILASDVRGGQDGGSFVKSPSVLLIGDVDFAGPTGKRNAVRETDTSVSTIPNRGDVTELRSGTSWLIVGNCTRGSQSKRGERRGKCKSDR